MYGCVGCLLVNLADIVGDGHLRELYSIPRQMMAVLSLWHHCEGVVRPVGEAGVPALSGCDLSGVEERPAS